MIKGVIKNKNPQKRAPAGREPVPTTDRPPNPRSQKADAQLAKNYIRDAIIPTVQEFPEYKKYVELKKAADKDKSKQPYIPDWRRQVHLGQLPRLRESPRLFWPATHDHLTVDRRLRAKR